MSGSKATSLFLAHTLATIAYRFSLALRDSPDGFGEFRAAAGVRTPSEIVRHMTHDLRGAEHALGGAEPERPPRLASLNDDAARFHGQLAKLAALLENDPPAEEAGRRLLQGPFADVLTHVGQIAMLRRLAGSPVAPENFHAADIGSDRLGPDQKEPAAPHARWRPAEEED